jgi:tetratricopeptide (TPR) repeat protein
MLYVELFWEKIFVISELLQIEIKQALLFKDVKRLKERAMQDLKKVKGLENKMVLKYVHAISLYFEGKPNKAMEILDTLEEELLKAGDIKLLPKVYYTKGMILCLQKKFDKAINSLKKAIKMQQGNYLFYRRSGVLQQQKVLLLLLRRKWDEDIFTQAIKMFETAVKIKPDDYMVYYRLSQVYLLKASYLLRKGPHCELSRAMQYIEKSISLNPAFPSAYVTLSSIIRRKTFILIHKDNKDPSALLSYGIRRIEEAIRLVPERASLYVDKALLHLSKGEWLKEKGNSEWRPELERTTKLLTKALTINDELITPVIEAEIYRLRGNVYRQLGYQKKAEKDWKKAQELRHKKAR